MSGGGQASLLTGVIMMGWIAGEVWILKRSLSYGTLWELFYCAVGLLMAAMGLVVGRAERRRVPPGSGRRAGC